MAILKKERNIMPEQEPEVRAHNFDEVALGFDASLAMDEATRCLNCANPLCVKGCPVGVKIPQFLLAVAKGEFEKAGEIIKTTNSLPSVCGRVCPQEQQCEHNCIRGKIDGAVAIGSVERFVGDYMLTLPKKEYDIKPTGKRVAVVGSGPAGITCSAQLAQKGVEVTVYEAFHKTGGVLVYGIPEFRLPKELVKAEIDKLRDLGVKFELNVVVGKTITLDELREQYDAVFIGSGAGLPLFMNIPGESLNGVLSANEYLTRINLMGAYDSNSTTPVQRGKQVAVIGAGNVAMDAARTALRMGAEKVSIIYRRGKDEMPARKAEIHHAEQEGIEFCLLTNPVEFLGKDGWVNEIKCVKMELGEPDASGRRSPVVVEGSEFTLPADMVIVALGTSPNPLIKDSCDGLETAKKGILVVGEDMMTSLDGVYAGGDAVTGSATVILAMGAGRKASEAILKRLNLD